MSASLDPGSEAPPVVTELAVLPDAHEVPISVGNDYICPACEAPIPLRRQIRMNKPPKYESALNDVMKCPFCNFIFSPRMTALVVRQ